LLNDYRSHQNKGYNSMDVQHEAQNQKLPNNEINFNTSKQT